LDNAANFFIAPNHWVELALASGGGQVAPVLFQRLKIVFRRVVGDTLIAANAH